MEVLYPHCAGLDVHKDTVVACVRHMVNGTVKREVRTFKTTTTELLALSDWLAAEKEVEPREISVKGAKQTLTAFATKLEAARPEERAGLVEAMLKAVGYHRVGDRPGRWEPRARKRSVTCDCQ